MHREAVVSYIDELKRRYDVRVYTPFKYFKGLRTKREVRSRFLDIVRGTGTSSSDPASYRVFQTDVKRPTRPSKYTVLFEERYGRGHTSLRSKSEVSGVPLDVLRRVFDKGKAAWRTGHRVGATETQWGYARVHSFLMLGCTVFSADFKLFEEALGRMTAHHRRQWLSLPVACPKTTLSTPHYKRRATYQTFLRYRRENNVRTKIIF